MSGKNIFAALQKKKSSKKPAAVKEDVPEEERVDKHAELEKAIFSAPTGGISNWADDSEDEWDANAHDHPAAAEEGWNQVRIELERDNALVILFSTLHFTDYICSSTHRSSLQATTKGTSNSRSQARMVAELQGDDAGDDGEESDDDGIHVRIKLKLF